VNAYAKRPGATVPSANRITLLRDTDGDGVAVDRTGALLVADDVGNAIWRVTPADSAQWRRSVKEYGMNWADAMRDSANVVSRDRAATDDRVLRRAESSSWDPHEVWLTRIKQPRERAARRVAASTANQTLKRPD
jgi:hypothetical protein